MGKGNLTAKKIATLSALTALSLIAFLIENLFPPLLIPGAKLGLANAFSLTALVMFTPVEAFAVVVIRTVLGAIFAGNMSAVMYSFTGGIVSMAVSSLLLYTVHPRLSLVCISVVAASLHNLTQNAVFVLLSGTPLAFSYAPYLMLIGAFSGAFIGIVVTLIFKQVPKSVLARALGVKPDTESDKAI